MERLKEITYKLFIYNQVYTVPSLYLPSSDPGIIARAVTHTSHGSTRSINSMSM